MMNQWGPALLIVFSILIGIVYGNKRLDDLRAEFKARFDAMEKRLAAIDQRFDGLEGSLNKRIDDFATSFRSELQGRFTELHRYLEARFQGVDQRLDRLEHPVAR